MPGHQSGHQSGRRSTDRNAGRVRTARAGKSTGTRVTFYRREDGTLAGFRASGHADYSEQGTDIVCAAVSALTQTALGGLTEVAHIPVGVQVDEDEGLLEARVEAEADEAQRAQAELLLRTLLGGLQAIEAQFPQNVCIFFEERRESTCS